MLFITGATASPPLPGLSLPAQRPKSLNDVSFINNQLQQITNDDLVLPGRRAEHAH